MTSVWRYWTPAGEAPPYSGWIGSVIDSLSPGARCDLTAADLPPAIGSVLQWVSPRAPVQQSWAHAANLVRWALLAEYGGVWLDHDVIPLVDLTALPLPWCASVGQEFVSCAIGLAAGDPLAAAMLAAGLEWGALQDGDQAAVASGDGLLNGWAGPHRSARIKRLARHHLAPIPLPFDAEGACVDGIYREDNTMARPPALVHLWHHREVAGKGNG